MSYAFAGLRGFGSLGGTFAPDCYLNTGKSDTLGKPLTDAEAASFRLTYGESANLVIAACNQSADPATCMGQNFLSKPFLGRPCQPEWRAWIQNKIIAAGAPPQAAALATQPVEPDNTLLYAGIGAAAVVAVGAVLLMRKK